MEKIAVRRFMLSDFNFTNYLRDIVEIAHENFTGMRNKSRASEWILWRSRGYPLDQYFIAILEGSVVGYILWTEEGGPREDGSVWELVQIAVKKEYQDKGIGAKLILESFEEVKRNVVADGRWIRLVKVTTGAENEAQRLYQKTLGATVVAIIPEYFRGPEAIMIARFQKPD